MPLAVGKDLYTISQNNPDYLEKNILEITKTMFQALQCMHGENLIHRDLKPENIIIDLDTNIVTLIDFGSLTSKDRKSYLNERFGTEMFWAPEVKKEDGYYDESTDIYAFAKTILDVLRWKQQTLLKKLTVKRKEGKDQDEEQTVFMEFILACLDQDPEKRKHAYFHRFTFKPNRKYFHHQARSILPI